MLQEYFLHVSIVSCWRPTGWMSKSLFLGRLETKNPVILHDGNQVTGKYRIWRFVSSLLVTHSTANLWYIQVGIFYLLRIFRSQHKVTTMLWQLTKSNVFFITTWDFRGRENEKQKIVDKILTLHLILKMRWWNGSATTFSKAKIMNNGKI